MLHPVQRVLYPVVALICGIVVLVAVVMVIVSFHIFWVGTIIVVGLTGLVFGLVSMWDRCDRANRAD